MTRRFTPALPRLEQLDLTFNTWRGRSVRYVLIVSFHQLSNPGGSV